MVNLRTLASLEPGDHLYWAYDTEEEHRALLTPFLRQGLERGEKVVYLADAHPPDVILDYLHDDGLETEPYLASGQLSILPACDVYLQERRFDVARMLAYVRQEMQRARAEGYAALRATGEMTWALQGTDGTLLVEYESRLNALFAGSVCLGLCQYHRQRFDPELLSQVLAAHPAAIVVEAPPEDPGRRPAVAAVDFGAAPEAACSHPQSPIVGEWTAKPSLRTISDQRALLPAMPELYLRLGVGGTILDCRVGQSSGPYLLPEALLGKRVADVLPPELGLEVQRAIDQVRGRNSLVTIECALQTPGGEQSFEVRATALPEQQVILFLQNTTERRWAERARRFLADVSAALTASLGYEATLRRVARLAVPVLADGCVVEVTQDRARPRLAVAHVDPAHEELLATIRRDCPVEAPIVSEVLRTGRPRVFREIPDSLLAALSRDAAHLEVLRQLGLESAMIVPLRGRGQTLGTISFLSATSGRRYSPAHLGLAEELAGRAAVAVDNAWLYSATQEARARAEAAERRMAFLAEASRALAASLDYETTLQSVARLAVPVLADWCVVEVLEENGASRQVAVAHVDPAKEDLLHEYHRRYPPRPGGAHPSYAAMRTGESQLLRDIPDSRWVAGSRDAVHLEIVRRVGLRSGIVVPLVARERTLGAISLASAEAGRYGPADLPLAEELARRCALAIDNSLLYRQAREAVRMRDEFLSAAAHELKTPVTSLRGFAQLTLRRLGNQGQVDQAQLQRALEVIDQQSDRLSRLVLQLLDVSRLEDGHLKLDRQVTDLARLIEDAVAIVESTATRHTFSVQAPSSLPALVDPLRLEQILINLLEGAIRFSQAGGLIEIEATIPDPATVRLSVQHHGEGIPREHRQHILDHMGKAHPDDHFGDLGLSLCISRRIARQHGGRIEVEFPPGGGTRFVVSLPRGLNGSDGHRGGEL